jgi:hypothetical protein
VFFETLCSDVLSPFGISGSLNISRANARSFSSTIDVNRCIEEKRFFDLLRRFPGLNLVFKSQGCLNNIFKVAIEQNADHKLISEFWIFENICLFDV